jgi:peroxiredoxin (alkyl hydroperoxide reductase subunit C)
LLELGDMAFPDPIPEEENCMAEEIKAGCARPTGGLVGETPDAETRLPLEPPAKEAVAMIKVGKKAPDFSAPAYHQGKFVSVRLSEHLGQWVLLCFYPGDFTFV